MNDFSDTLLDELQSRLSALPEEAVGPNVSLGMASGLQAAKKFIISIQLKPLKNKLKDNNEIKLQTVQLDFSEILTRIEGAQAKLQSEKSGTRSTSTPR